MDDVIGWMISVAKKHKIPVEDMNMHRFANCTGSLLSLMSQKNFVDRDNAFGNLLFSEFRQMLKGTKITLIDTMLKKQLVFNIAKFVFSFCLCK